MTKIVTIGGGTGSYVLLSGLKKYPVDITAIVSMADDGGSTGVLRDELGVLPPGDVRQCLVALAESSETLRELMGYRFEHGTLKGHNFGNIFLSALEKTTGSFSDGVLEAGKILNIRGTVLPVSEENMRLRIHLKNGELLYGEKELDDNRVIQRVGIEKIVLEDPVQANRKALRAIEVADVIVLGPGDHYGSILPNLLVSGVSEAITASSAQVIYVANLTNKKGHTDAFDIDDYTLDINRHLGSNRVDFVVSNGDAPSQDLLRRYEKKEGKGAIVSFRREKIPMRSYRVAIGSLLKGVNHSEKSQGQKNSDTLSHTRSFIRHDSHRLAEAVMFLARKDTQTVLREIV